MAAIGMIARSSSSFAPEDVSACPAELGLRYQVGGTGRPVNRNLVGGDEDGFPATSNENRWCSGERPPRAIGFDRPAEASNGYAVEGKSGIVAAIAIDDIREALAEILSSYLVHRVYLFGSQARGYATQESDVDLAFEEYVPLYVERCAIHRSRAQGSTGCRS